MTKGELDIVEVPWWRLEADVGLGHVLLWIASMRNDSVVQPEIYLWLGDRYWRLARRHFLRGQRVRAQRLVGKARGYFMRGGGPEPPPLACATMPIPDARSLVRAIGVAGRRGRGNDAA